MNLLIRADSSSTIGLGHIMRDLVLAEQYPDAKIVFACQDLSGNIIDSIPYPVHILKSNDPEELIALIRSYKINLLIIDHYGIDDAFEKKIKEQTGVSILCLDDTHEKHHCDILLNHNISADKSRYTGLVPPHCELQCGSDYTLIRDEFKYEKTISRENFYDIFIAIGGADTANLTPKILKMLSDTLQLCVVTTSANAHLRELENYIKEKKNITLHINSNDIAKLLHQSRLAIITPSVMVHEVLFMEIPFIAIQTAPNQDDLAQYLHNHKFCIIRKFRLDIFQKKLQRFTL